jgi:glycine/D-amino acid oxidase-like deaminating enzyme
MKIIVVGAGTFGASLAWWLARRDAGDITLIDQFPPGDRRATSGGETRLIRCSHGADADYTAMARRARTLWRELEAESGEELMLERGVAWFAHSPDGWEAASERTMAAQDIPVERVDVADAARLFPSVRGDDLAFVLLEPEAGVLRAQRAVQALARQAEAHGARQVRARARPDGDAVVLEHGSRLEADLVIWACGGWLAQLFGDLLPLTVRRQELLFLDGGDRWQSPDVPAWVDYDRAMYGTSDIDGLGVKAALDVEGPPIDPDAPLDDEPQTEATVRAYLRERFPPLSRARLRETRTCRYELSPDSHFIAGRHPQHPSHWIVGGGSGHGFKHGPAMAERVVAAIAGETPLPDHFALGERAPARSFRTAGSGVVS